jgi:hypothetical protein
MVIEKLHADVFLELLDRDLARKAVIGAVEPDDLGDQALDERQPLREYGLQNCLSPLEGHDIARTGISIDIARDIGDGLAGLAVGGDAFDLEYDPGVIVCNDLIAPRQHVDNLCLVAIGLGRRDVGGDDRVGPRFGRAQYQLCMSICMGTLPQL